MNKFKTKLHELLEEGDFFHFLWELVNELGDEADEYMYGNKINLLLVR